METIIAQFATLALYLRAQGFDSLARRVEVAFSLARGRVSDATVLGNETVGVEMLRGAHDAIERALSRDWTGTVRSCAGVEAAILALCAIARMKREVLDVSTTIGQGCGARFGRDAVAARLARSVEPVKAEPVEQGLTENGWRIAFSASNEWKVWCSRWRDGERVAFDLGTFPMLIEALDMARNVDAPEQGKAPRKFREARERLEA